MSTFPGFVALCLAYTNTPSKTQYNAKLNFRAVKSIQFSLTKYYFGRRSVAIVGIQNIGNVNEKLHFSVLAIHGADATTPSDFAEFTTIH